MTDQEERERQDLKRMEGAIRRYVNAHLKPGHSIECVQRRRGKVTLTYKITAYGEGDR